MKPSRFSSRDRTPIGFRIRKSGVGSVTPSIYSYRCDGWIRKLASMGFKDRGCRYGIIVSIRQQRTRCSIPTICGKSRSTVEAYQNREVLTGKRGRVHWVLVVPYLLNNRQHVCLDRLVKVRSRGLGKEKRTNCIATDNPPGPNLSYLGRLFSSCLKILSLRATIPTSEDALR